MSYQKAGMRPAFQAGAICQTRCDNNPAWPVPPLAWLDWSWYYL